MTIWLVGHPQLAHILQRAPYAALAGRLQARVQLQPFVDRERFRALVQHGLKSVGSQQTMISDSGMEILRQASKGLPREISRILCTAMRLAVPKGLNHLPDELLTRAVKEHQ
jgi:type II secretory pathway predicted ATPase ExeA